LSILGVIDEDDKISQNILYLKIFFCTTFAFFD